MDPAGHRFAAPRTSVPLVENRRGLPIPRRKLLGLMAGGLAAAPLAACGRGAKEARIGLLTERTLPPSHLDALRRGLTELGWIEERGLRIEQRSADGQLERLTGLAADLVDSDVAVIVTGL